MGFVGELDVGLKPDAAGEEFAENGGILSDEVNGAGGDVEGGSVVGDDGDGEGLGGLGFDEVLGVEKGEEVLLSLDGVVEAAVADAFDGGVEEGTAVEDGRRAAWGWERADEEVKRGHDWLVAGENVEVVVV